LACWPLLRAGDRALELGLAHLRTALDVEPAGLSDQLVHREPALSWWQFLGTAHFWEATLQNWQSEFFAVGSMAVLAIYVRPRGSPESKPVGASNAATGVDG
jgi:hypothetical protein